MRSTIITRTILGVKKFDIHCLPVAKLHNHFAGKGAEAVISLLDI